MKSFCYNVDSSLHKSWSPGGREGPPWEKPYLHVFILKTKSSQEPAGQFQSNDHWMKELKLVQKNGQVLFQREIITEMQKLGGIISISSSHEPLSHKCSYLHERCLI
jgi:hypothetical protein